MKSKLVLVTGGASGIGRLVALDFARRGERVVVWDLNAAALAALEKEAAEAGFALTAAVCDVSDREAVYREARTLTEKQGPLDTLINNAGIVNVETLLKISDENVEKMMNVNVLSMFWTVKAFLPSMIERNSGHIVTIASAAGIIGVRGLAAYCAGKFAAVGFDETLRMELGCLKSKVRTTLVCPFFIDTGMFEGVKTRIPLLLPILKSEYAARRIVNAVLRKRKRLIMPRFVYTVYFLRILPLAALDFAAKFFGINHSLDNFTGRRAGAAEKH